MDAGHAKEGDTSSPPRQRFYIELKPGETTIVSWKKLLKDAAANKANPSDSNNQTAAAAAASTSAFVMEPASGETAQQEALFALKNLREMVEMGLTAKQEKADRFQKIKKEVMEMIELQKAIIHGEKGAINRKYVMDDKMEDKICDLYDLFVQGMDEDKGPQIRKLYAEVAELWPNGAMDNHGIKIAICRAKERRRIFYNNEKVQEKARIEKLSRQWKGNNVGGKATSNARAKCEQGGVSASAAIAQYLSGPARPIPSFLKSRSDDPPKQEKLEKMTFPMLKEQMKQQKREFDRGLKKSSPKVDRKSHMSHMQDVGMQDGL